MRRFFNKRRLLITGIGGVSLILILALAAFLFVRLGYFSNWIAGQMKASLAEYNVRVEIGSVKPDIRHLRMEMENVRFFAGKDKEPFASFTKLDAGFRIRDLFKFGSPTEVGLRDLKLDGLKFWYRLDDKGVSNLSKLDFTKRKTEKDRVTFDYSAAELAVAGAELFYIDTLRKLDGTARNVHLKATSAGKDGFRIAAGADDCNFVYDGRESKDLQFQLTGLADEAGAKVDELVITSPLLQARMSGHLNDWEKLEYALDAKADVKVNEVTRLFLPATRINGSAHFDGKVTGKGVEYEAHGKLTSNDLQARDVRISGINLKFNGSGKGAEYAAQEELMFEKLDAAGFKINRAVAAGRITGNGNAINWLPNFRAAQVTGPSFTATGVKFSNARINFPADDFERFKATGKAMVDHLIVADVNIGNLTGDVTATRNELVVPNFNGSVFGGSANGSARIKLYGSGASEVTANLVDLNLDQVAAVGAGNRLPIRGLTKGTVNVAWHGSDYKSAEGSANLQFTGSTVGQDGGAPGAPTIPINGELNATASNRVIRIDRTILQSGSSRVTVSGAIGWDRTGTLEVGLNSENAMELQSLGIDIARAFAPKATQEFIDQEIQLTNKMNFTGEVTGSLDQPKLAGHFKLDAVNWHDELVGAVSGDLAYADRVLKVNRGNLRQPEGGAADFTVTYPLDVENGISVATNLRNLSLGTALRAVASLPIQLDGQVTGASEITGLPDAIRGNARFSIVNGKYGTRPIDAFDGQLVLNGSRIDISGLSLRSGQGTLAGSISYDTKTKGYKAKLDGKGIDLNEWVNLTREEGESPIPLTGLVNVSLEAEAAESTLGEKTGRLFDTLSAKVDSQELQYKGEPIRNLALSISGRNSVANLELKADALSQTHTGSGKVDFSKTDAPISLTVDFNDTEVARLMALFSGNELEAGGRTSGQIRLAGNLFGSVDKVRLETEFSKLYFDVTDYRLTASTPFTIKVNSDQLDLGTIRLSGSNTNVTVVGSIALGQNGRNALGINGDVNLKVIQTLTREAFADGTLKIEAAATGTYKQPKFSGQASLQDGSLRIPGFPLGLTRARARLLFTADQAQLAMFEADVGTGKIRATGGASFVGFKPNRWRFQIKPEGVRVDYPRDTRTTLDGDLELQGSRDIQLLSGIVNVRRTEYLTDVDLFEFIQRLTEEFGNPSIGAAQGDGTAIPPTQMDIRVVANETLNLRTKLIDVTGSLNLRLKGPIDDPTVAGRITISSGTVDNIFGQRFRISNAGTIEFRGVDKRAGQLNIEAEADIKGYRVIANFSGLLDQPRFRLRAEPSLPEPEVYNLIATGRLQNEDRLTSSSTSQSLVQTSLNTAASFIAQRASRSVESNVTGRLFGLNRFSLDPLLTGRGTDPTARITVGRRVTKDLSITYSTNLATNQDQVILIEYQASDRLSFVASRAQDGTFGLDVRLRKRF